jgi:2-haloacid dehalogenase
MSPPALDEPAAPESGNGVEAERKPKMAGLDLDRFEALTFDCYGTLIDWETGILAALRPVLEAHGAGVEEEGLLEAFGRHETAIESGGYMPYREVLAGVLGRLGDELGFSPTGKEVSTFAGSVGEWPPFADSTPALRALGRRFGLGVITNCDDDLFARSAQRLGVEFDWVVTAERVRAYKPSHRNFELAFETIGLPTERILHVAQSLFHDHVPAKQLGLATVWVDRREGRAGPGATRPAAAEPDLRVPDMSTLAELAAG